jgi:chemotaxis protein MotB
MQRRRGENGLNPWPGYVDALSTLLMVIIFVLLVFVLAQAFLAVTLSSRDKQLDQVNRELASLNDMLSLEHTREAALTASIAQLNEQVTTSREVSAALAQRLATAQGQLVQANQARQDLTSQLADANARALATAEQVAMTTQERAALAAQLAAVQTQLAEASAARDQLAARLAETTQARDQLAARLAETTQARDRLSAQLAETAQARDQAAAKLAETTEARERLATQLTDTTQARDRLMTQLADATARAAAAGQQIAEDRKFSDSARAQIALLTQQVEQLRAQIAAVANALDLAEAAGRDKDVQIANLGQRLNAALAAKVEELQQYRSEFFGKLRQVLANRPGISIVGDRFVFQSEVLFPVGSAELTDAGKAQINDLAATIKQIIPEIPANIHWIMRIDGHTDRQPIKGGPFASNWELSAARAITVVNLLIADGVPPEHLAATGFADYQPLDAADTPEAYGKNRRIELRLTDR